MNLKTIISDIVAGLTPAGTFRYGWKSFQNFKADNESVFPLRYLDYPLSGKYNMKRSGLAEPDFFITMAFLDLQPEGLSSTPDQCDVIIEEQRQQSIEFLTACQNSELIHFVRDDASFKEIVNIFDMSLSGIILTVTLVPFNNNTC